MKKPVSYKRVLAYLLDTIIITMIATLLTMFIPTSEEYQQKTKELNDVMESFTKEEITQEEYLEKVNDINYIINKETISTSIVTIVLTTIYFVVVAYYMEGQTLGKKIMKLKVVSTNDNKITMNKLLIRSLIVDSILMNIISIVTILLMTKSLYLQTYDIITTIFGAIYIVTFSMILFREDGRGLHDIIAKTKVISIEEKLEEIAVIKEEIEEKSTIETPKEDNKEKKAKTTKTSRKK